MKNFVISNKSNIFAVLNKTKEIMKKFMLMVAFAAATLAVNAQVYVGGSLGFGSNKPMVAEGAEAETTTSFSIKPEVGYNLDDKWTVGIGLGFEYAKAGDAKTTGFSIEPYARYTFVKWGNVGLFAEAGVGYGSIDEDDVKVDEFYIGVRPGISFAASEKISLVAKLGWLGWQTFSSDGCDNSSNFNLAIDGSDISLGVYYNF